MKKMDISIIIVNYNVRLFLDQCLRSVAEALEGLNAETIVVDNDSIDGSVQHVVEYFPWVRLIANNENVGFAAANNIAIREAKGKYILLLNPDTIIEKDTLKKCFDFMESTKDCGAVGVRMIDGNGKFLPESKRGFPSPFASLMRLTGLSRVFPKSRLINRYNLGFLPEDEVNEIDVLCGAFMFMRKEALDEVGLLDEAFFMYGEDIDLSYRIQKGGYSIYYLPTTTIVHFKGESTKKSSLKYYSTFYSAMAIFAKKHYGGKALNPFLWLINLAIFLIGFSDFVAKSLSKLILPLFEFLVFFALLKGLEYTWAKYYFGDAYYYEDFNSLPIYLIYSLIWVLSLWISGSYRSIRNVKRLFWGVLGGSAGILILYALMDNSLRHSRAIILLSSVASLVVGWLIRRVFVWLRQVRGGSAVESLGRVVLVGKLKDVEKTKEILSAGLDRKKELIGVLDPDNQSPIASGYLQNLDKLEQVIEVFNVDEVLFSSENVALKDIMTWMTRLRDRVRIKIFSKDVQSIIGSHDRNSRGDLYTVELKYNIKLPYLRFAKLFVDYLVAVLLLLFSPIFLLFTFRFRVFKNAFSLIFRKKSLVSYIDSDVMLDNLPFLIPGIVAPVAMHTIDGLSQEEKHSINFYYARDYSILGELGIILLNVKYLI
jgi:GT2 family glycosyltransferase